MNSEMRKQAEINGKTRLIGLMGNPVEHTLSPVIHNGISKRMGITSVYVPFKVEADAVSEAVQGAYALNVLGMNVTVPHKNRVMDTLQEIDPAAARIGAVNTLVRVEGGYKGYNTDMSGLRRQMHEDAVKLEDQTVVILGAGGAAKAVCYMCMLENARKIYILNRTVAKAEAIAEAMQDARIVPMPLEAYTQIPEEHLVVFQATSIGLSPHVDAVVLEDPAFYKRVDTGVDLIYNPATTKFMKLVREQGGTAYNALKMLLYQGVIAYELWHSIKVPQDVIDAIYLDLIRKIYPKDNIVLIGFMGSGKSTVGRQLADRLHMQLLDTDAWIEQQEGCSIAEIFAGKGEAYFRMAELRALQTLRDTVHGTILSTGGGMPLRKENADLLKQIGSVYYLTAASQVIYDRVKDNRDRPLLQGEDPYGTICSLMKQRRPYYEAAADYRIDTNSNDLDEVCDTIEALYRETNGQ